MDEFTRAHPYAGILLLGDFNQLPDSELKSFPLQQIVTCPTRGNSISDKIYTNVTDWYQTPIILPGVSRSDHEAIHLKPAADPPRPSRSILEERKKKEEETTGQKYNVRICYAG